MAQIWFVREGNNPTSGDPACDFPLDACANLLDLSKQQRLCDLDEPLNSDDEPRPPLDVKPYRHVVCEIGEAEAEAHGWDPGFYRLEISPQEVIDRLEPAYFKR